MQLVRNTTDAPARPGIKVWKLAGGVALVLLVVQLARMDFGKPAPAPALTPEQAAAKAADDALVRERGGAALAGANALKRAAKNPATFSLDRVVLKPDRSICYEFRAANGFNATISGSAVAVQNGNLSFDASAWNARCTKAGGVDLTDVVRPRID